MSCFNNIPIENDDNQKFKIYGVMKLHLLDVEANTKNEFKCDKYSKMYTEKGWKLDDVPYLTVQEEEGMIRIDIDEIENGAAVFLTADTAAKLCQEILKIVDKIQGFEIVPPTEITVK